MKVTMAILKLADDATEEQVQARVSALAQFEDQVLSATGATSSAEAVGKIASGAEALRDLPGVAAELVAERTNGIKRDLRSTLEAGLASKRLDLGRIQKGVPLVLRGEQKAAWVKAMGDLKKITQSDVLDAACSVAISADDLAAIGEYAKSASLVSAETHAEPERKPDEESAELDETAQIVKTAADNARKTLDRNKSASAAK